MDITASMLGDITIRTEVRISVVGEGVFHSHVRQIWEHIEDKTRDKHYPYYSLALYVAEHTKSVVERISDTDFLFSYVGI